MLYDNRIAAAFLEGRPVTEEKHFTCCRSTRRLIRNERISYRSWTRSWKAS